MEEQPMAKRRRKQEDEYDHPKTMIKKSPRRKGYKSKTTRRKRIESKRETRNTM